MKKRFAAKGGDKFCQTARHATAAEMIQGILSKIIVTGADSVKNPFAPREFSIEIHGDLSRLLGPTAPETLLVGTVGSGGGIRTPDTRIMIPLL